ncbi:O-methyltransferase [Bacillus tuaregi]|uniref:O-methyltransferase n=1 Tax=Bacillus tuaregi TaxID=1816695 RepID=UPI0008F94786|nr:O-methyltransferase [Bacillus tuaregi]
MKSDKIQAYIENLIPDRPDFFIQMEAYASENNVPIMELAGMEAMLQFLRLTQPERILEVGTAIGYSALRMADALPNARITTIERDVERAALAQQYIKQLGKEEQIELIIGDALEVEADVASSSPYDVIFIDAAKGQYKKFFELYSGYLTEQGIIVTDNVLFKGLVAEEQIESKRTANLVKKIRQFNEWLMKHSDYHTVIIPVGDGVAISKKR